MLLRLCKITPIFRHNYPCINNLDKVINKPPLPVENPIPFIIFHTKKNEDASRILIYFK